MGYTSEVSRNVIPPAAARSRMAIELASSHCRPKVMVPRQSWETGSPVRPRRTCRIATSLPGWTPAQYHRERIQSGCVTVYDPTHDRSGREDTYGSALITGVSGCPRPDHRAGTAGPCARRRPRGALGGTDHLRRHRHACADVVRSRRDTGGDHALPHALRTPRRACDLVSLTSSNIADIASRPHSFRSAE